MNARPAVIDGQVVWLPTLAGLLKGQTSVEGGPNRDLWSAMAAAVLSDQAFEEIDSHLARGGDLADLIDPDGGERPTGDGD